ncbi:hypothetical protein A1O3_09483 [Capronia epimyces CBS 606.96]|uniref:SET domain-containing protein n=1 Tax=Capronia epimyces CBS 606.96 TaxID=1182542 RepID=W9XCV8_9EURO|nr:uncharacterized protein A1O3_09483 [Capronia epimyces CBS 606.96]EXJ78322.1 hypothetical protein A1O3_09483 [Capronia epimyces CBS 606.96]
MSQKHPYRSLHVPNDAPFKLKPSPGKGWGAFATRRIEQGAMILKEKPLFVLRKPHQEITEADIRAAFDRLGPSEKRQFLLLRDNGSSPFSNMERLCAENSFTLSTNSPGHGLFLLHSRFNHSCVPNSKVPTTGDEVIVSYATRDIDADEEITFCYNTDFECRTRHERHQALRFTCDCKACLTGTPFQQVSDMRRRLLRGLQYLTVGVDLDGRRQDSTLIIDSKLKKAAQDSSIPLSSRLFYYLLTMCLLAEEGLLDDFMVERYKPAIETAVALFRTESNVVIVRHVMAQKSWLGKCGMATRL